MIDDKKLSDFMPKTNSDDELVFGDISNSKEDLVTKKTVITVLSKINDPELKINIYDLGLIYDIIVDEFNNIKITMTLTTVNCPVADSFPLDVAKKVHEIPNVGQVGVKLTFEPPWNKDMMSEDAKLALGY
jgi:FeS assembly SUF system protein